MVQICCLQKNRVGKEIYILIMEKPLYPCILGFEWRNVHGTPINGLLRVQCYLGGDGKHRTKNFHKDKEHNRLTMDHGLQC